MSAEVSIPDEGGRYAHLYPLTEAELERVAALRAMGEKRRRRREENVAVVDGHERLLAEVTGLRRAVLHLHRPRHEGSSLVCRECFSCEGDGPPFPCETYVLARDWEDTPAEGEVEA